MVIQTIRFLLIKNGLLVSYFEKFFSTGQEHPVPLDCWLWPGSFGFVGKNLRPFPRLDEVNPGLGLHPRSIFLFLHLQLASRLPELRWGIIKSEILKEFANCQIHLPAATVSNIMQNDFILIVDEYEMVKCSMKRLAIYTKCMAR